MLHQAVSNVNRFKKRERTQNWAYEEKRFLLDLCKRDMSIIENKRLDADLTSLKNRSWKIIHQEFSKAFGNERNCNRLKEQWRRMKACTRAEILDYNQRLARFGQDVADKKRPNPFSFEIWEFMQDAKKACRSEALEGVDYSKVRLNLEDVVPDGIIIESDDDNSNWQEKQTQNMCEVEIKEESSDDLDQEDQSKYLRHTRPFSSTKTDNDISYYHSNDVSTNFNDDMPSLSINNVAATLDTLKMLKNGQFGSSTPQTTKFNSNSSLNNDHDDDEHMTPSNKLIEMQNKEHAIRMEILQIQLQTAKYNRDLSEINKLIALRNYNTLVAEDTNGINNHKVDIN